MLLRPITSESISRNFELASAIPERHESEHPEQESNRFGTDILHRAHVDGLAIISKPVPEVDALDVHFAELLAPKRHKGKKCVFDVAMAPVGAFDFGDASDVACRRKVTIYPRSSPSIYEPAPNA